MSIQIDSRKIKEGDTFIALKGYEVDGHKFIDKAIENGAKKVVCEYGSYQVETLIVKDTKAYLEETFKEMFEELNEGLKFVGVTGTNGKTTTCYLTYQLLNKLNNKSSFIGTVGFYLDDTITEVSNTTPDIVELYNMIKKSKESEVKTVVVEVSSHALKQNRLNGIILDTAGFTNLTLDHLDYHKTFEDYLESKLKIKNLLKKDGILVVNKDVEYADKFIDKNSLTISKDDGDYKIEKYLFEGNTSYITFTYDNFEYSFHVNYVGDFNVYNTITAIAMVHNLGYEINDILSVIEDIKLPKGRSETTIKDGKTIVVDYAHTPDAVEKILNVFLPIKKRKIYTIIGCTGDRDRSKRPIMSRLVTDKSDYVIFTDDDLHNEDPLNIEKDMITDLDKTNWEFIHDRKKAIHKGIDLMKKDDILLILGKGHEDYIVVKDNKKIPHNDTEEVKEYLNI